MNQVAKSFLRTAGGQLGGYLDKALNIGGKVGQDAATAAAATLAAAPLVAVAPAPK